MLELVLSETATVYRCDILQFWIIILDNNTYKFSSCGPKVHGCVTYLRVSTGGRYEEMYTKKLPSKHRSNQIVLSHVITHTLIVGLIS